MDGIAKLLTDPTNYAVVQFPGRQFPGVVFQGDSIHALLAHIKHALDAARNHNDDDLNAELEDALELLTEAQEKLKSVCDREGVALPWPTAESH
jgi:predicted RNase H-like HicB family nuclease